jgi:hypothetical protein
MVPTIAALTEPQGPRGESAAASVPLLIAGAEPSQPAAAIELPGDVLALLEPTTLGDAAKWPRLEVDGEPLGTTFPAGAIRLPRAKTISDAELFVPFAEGEHSLMADARPAVSWLIEAGAWDRHDLAQALQAVSRQAGAAADCVLLVGRLDSPSLMLAKELFADRVGRHSDIKAAMSKLRTPLVGWLGAGVLLHDCRTVDILSHLLNNDAVATSACVLISIERRGKAWRGAISDSGAFYTVRGTELASTQKALLAEQLWRSNYPVAAPSPDLWLARSSRAREWVAGGSPGALIHTCSSLVTASCLSRRASGKPPRFIPETPAQSVPKVKALFG